MTNDSNIPRGELLWIFQSWITTNEHVTKQTQHVKSSNLSSFPVQLVDVFTWLKSLSLITWDIKPWIASMVVLQLKSNENVIIKNVFLSKYVEKY